MTVKVTELIDTGSVIAFSTERCACDAADPYSGFSTCSYTGDDPRHVEACRHELARFLHVGVDSLVMPRQTHSANVAVVTHTPVNLEDTDALVTNLRGTALCIHTADCVPVLLADMSAGVIGAAHSGWRGAEKRIAEATVLKMQELGAEPRRIVAALGPCICEECFEVGEEVACRFDRYGAVDRSGTQPHVNLAGVVARTLLDAGLLSENITHPPGCSLCGGNRYFSARQSGVGSGRTVSVIMLR